MREQKNSIFGWAVVSAIGLFGSLLLYGCQSMQGNNRNQAAIDNQPLERRIGIIRSLGGVKTSTQGTHVLQMEDGTNILLRSLQINLDDAAYIGKKVEVRGILNYTTDKVPLMEVMNIDEFQSDLATEQIIQSWKDYSADNLGFSIKYRDDLIVNTQASGVSFLVAKTIDQTQTQVSSSSQSEHFMSIARLEIVDSDGFIKKLGTKSLSQTDLTAAGYSRSRIGIDSVEAIKRADGSKSIYNVDNGSYMYIVTIDTGNDSSTITDQNLFYEMLGSLKFATITRASTQEDLVRDIGTTQPISITLPKAEPAPVTKQTTQVLTTTSQLKFEPLPESPTPAPVITQVTIEEKPQLEGFTSLESETFNFNLQYPKNWYYTGSAGSTGVIRKYDFGTKPLDESPGSVTLELLSGGMPAGGPMVTKTNGELVEIYVQGAGTRVYKLTGPAAEASTLTKMASTISSLN